MKTLSALSILALGLPGAEALFPSLPMYKDQARAMFFGTSGDDGDSFLSANRYGTKTHELMDDRYEMAKWNHIERTLKNNYNSNYQPIVQSKANFNHHSTKRELHPTVWGVTSSSTDEILGFIYGLQYSDRNVEKSDGDAFIGGKCYEAVELNLSVLSEVETYFFAFSLDYADDLYMA